MKRLLLSVLLLAPLSLALALLPFPLAALLAGLAALTVLALIDPVWGLYAAVLSVTLQEVVRLPGGLTFTQGALLLAAGSWTLHVLAYPEREVRWGRLTPGLLALTWVLGLATVTTPYSLAEGMRETLRWAIVLLIYWLALNTLRSPYHIGGLLVCLLAAPLANALVGLWQFFTATGPLSFALAGGRFVRAYGTIGQPNSFAGYLNMAWPLGAALTLGLVYAGWLQFRRAGWAGLAQRPFVPAALLLATMVTALLLAALLASFSRGAWVGALAGAAVMALMLFSRLAGQWRPRALKIAAIGLAIGVLFLAVGGTALLPSALTARVVSIAANLRVFDVRTVETTPANFAIVERMSHLQVAWAMFQRYPLTGVGPGNYSIAYETPWRAGQPPLAPHPWYESRGHAHNYYLHMAAEAGLLGLGAYLALLAILALNSAQALRHARDWLSIAVVVGAGGVVAAVAGHNLFENLHVLQMGIQLAAIWALIEVMMAQRQSGATVAAGSSA